MRKLILLILLILIIPIASAICCEKGKECIISEACQDGSCGDCSISIYERDGGTRIPFTDMRSITSFSYIYNATTNFTSYGTFPYSINCTTAEVCQGDCYVEVKSECGEEGKGNMFAGIGILLIGITIAFVYFAINSKQRGFQIFFALLAFLMVIADFRFASIMVESLDSSLTGLIHNLDTMYMVSIIIFRWLLIFSIIMLLHWVYKLLKLKSKKKMKSEDWEMEF